MLKTSYKDNVTGKTFKCKQSFAFSKKNLFNDKTKNAKRINSTSKTDKNIKRVEERRRVIGDHEQLSEIFDFD